MIALIRRALVAAVTPRPLPASDLVAVRPYTRRRPVNPKRQALHDQLRTEIGQGRPAGHQVQA